MRRTDRTNYVAIADGYNLCPQCGRPAYAVATEDQMYRVGCIHCGLMHGVGTYVEDGITEAIADAHRILWNEQYFTSVQFTEEVMEALDMDASDYILVDNRDKYILRTVETVGEVKRYVRSNPDIPIGIYQVICGSLQYMGHSYFVGELIGP